jgi:hypothetical protein
LLRRFESYTPPRPRKNVFDYIVSLAELICAFGFLLFDAIVAFGDAIGDRLLPAKAPRPVDYSKKLVKTPRAKLRKAA